MKQLRSCEKEGIMKLSKIMTCVLIGILVGSGVSSAQISINWPGINPRTIDVGINKTVPVTGLNLAQTGGPQTWDYIGFMPIQNSIDIILPGNFPPEDAPAFPTAEWAYKTIQYIPEFAFDIPGLGTISIEDTTVEIYNYRKISNGWMEELGTGFHYELMQGSPFVYGTPSQVYPNPLTVNAAEWLEKRTFNAVMQISILQINAIITDSTIVSVNGYGTINLPTGSYPCIQLKRKEIRKIYIPPVPPLIPSFYQEQESYTYMWITHGFDMVLMVTSFHAEAVFDTADAVIMPLAPVGVGCDPNDPLCEIPGIIPTEFILGQNFPNPFNPTTTIRYALPTAANVELNIFSLLGQKVMTIESDLKSAGSHTAFWQGRDSKGNRVPGGIYFYRLKATPINGGETVVQTRKMIMTK